MERGCEEFFERFQVPSFYLANSAGFFCSFVFLLNKKASFPVLALLAVGKTTGMAIDIGEESAHCVPVFDCASIRHAARKFDVPELHLF